MTTVKDPVVAQTVAAVVSPPPAKFSVWLNQCKGTRRSVARADKALPSIATATLQSLNESLPDDEGEDEGDETGFLDKTLDERNEVRYFSKIRTAGFSNI